MNLIVLVGLFFSQWVSADVIYMQENQAGKSIIYQAHNGPARTINNLNSKMWAIYPDITPDGQEVIYAEGPDQSDLHLTYQHQGKELTQRFHSSTKGMILHPKFSKNGKLIFYSAPGPKGKNTIYFFDRAAEVARQGNSLLDFSLDQAQALDDAEESYFPRPSSDGNFVVYQRNSSGKKEIILFDRLENTKKVIAEGMSPALSFDERWIAFTSKVNGSWDIFITERTTGVTFQATSDAKDEQAPTFMPDNTLAFASNKTGHYRLYKIIKGEWISMNQGVADSAEVDFYSPNFTGNTLITQGLKAPFIGNPRSSFGTVTHNGKLYMAGGHQGAEHTYPPESFSDLFIVFDIESNSWKALAPRPVKAHGYQLAAYGNYVYAFGGFAYSADHKPKWKSLDQIDRYDIANNKWETIGKLHSPRSSNVAVEIDGKIYIAGGWNSTPKFENDLDGVFLDTIEIFDVKTGTVELANFKLPTKRRALTGIEHEGKILLIGGIGEGASHFELLNNVTSINPVDGYVKELSPLPFATFAPAAEILNGHLFVFGGMFKTGPMSYEYVSHIYGQNLALGTWSHTGRCLKETKGFSQVFKLDEKTLGVLGGHHYFEGYDSPVSTFETFSNVK